MKSLILTGIYLLLLLTVHIVPVVGHGLGQVVFAGYQVGSLLQILFFLPWMVIGYKWRLNLRRQSLSLSTAAHTCKPVTVSLLTLISLVLFGMVTAIGLEGLQLLLPYRSFNALDGVFNLIGVLIGLPLVWIRKW